MKRLYMKHWLGRMMLLAVWLVASGRVAAQHVSEDAARTKALRFLNESVEQRVRKAPRHAPRLQAALVTDEYYVFNDADNAGFVIVSGEEGTEAILGYSDEGTFDAGRMPDNVRAWLDGYAEQIRAVAALGSPVAGDAGQSGAGGDFATVAPLLKTRWGQGSPFNGACPVENGKYCVTGCLPTAMAQVMYYYRWPEAVGEDIPPLNTDEAEWVIGQGTPLAYDQMLTSYSSGAYTQEQADAVALLMRACGQAAKAAYGVSETTTNWGMDLMAMKRFFHYNPDATVVSRLDYTDSEWEALICRELSEKRPVPYRGNQQNAVVGHQFICDGYSGNHFFHINWGWGGNSDGYFLLALQTSAAGTRYSDNQAATIGLQPDSYEAYVPEVESDGMFEETTAEGVKVKYHILSEEDKTVQVGSGNVQAIDLLTAGQVTIPAQVRGYSVVNVGQWAFLRCEEMTSVVLPATVTGIDPEAFWGCTGLQSAVLSDEITSIGDYAFSNCFALSQVNMPKSLQTLGMSAFWGCGELSGELVLPEGLKSIGKSAFVDNGYTSVVLPDGLETLDEETFWGCWRMESVHLPKGLTTLGDRVFVYCESLKSVEIPAAVKKMGTEVFGCCYGLEEATFLTTKLTTLPELTFDHCSKLASVTLPEGLKTIQTKAFYSCEMLAGISFPTSMMTVQDNAFAYSGLRILKLAEGMTNVRAKAFRDCLQLESLELAPGTYSIGEQAFCNCERLKAVVLPATVLRIQSKAFAGCTALETVESGILSPAAIDASTFDGAYETALLKVPTGTKSLYAEKEGWKLFLHMEEAEATAVADVKSDATADGAVAYFDLQGRRLSAPAKGVCLMRRADGTVVKMMAR